MKRENLIQVVESYLNIILYELGEKEHRDFIENTPKLKKYDDMMWEYNEKDIPYELIKDVYEIVKNKVKSL